MTRQLNEQPLGELIREINDAGLSGALRLSRERAKAVVYFDSGEIIYAASNLRTYRLSECVKRWGVLNEQQLSRVQGKTSDADFGEALVEIGALSRDSLSELVAHQVSEVLCHILLWIDGEWDFDSRVRLTGGMRVQVKMNELLLESARRLPASSLASKFRDNNEKLSLVSNAPDNLILLPTEAFVLTRVDTPVSVNELLAMGGLPENETLQVIYTLTMGGLLRLENWPRALSSEEISKALAAKDSPSKPFKAESKTESKSASQKEAKSEPEEKLDEKAELEALFTRLSLATNYYQTLGVVRPVTDADIKRAYHSLAKRFHPDRYRKSVDDQTHTRVEGAFAEIAQAYEALKDKQSRAVYDTKLMKRDEAGGAGGAAAGGAAARTLNQESANVAQSADAATPKPSDSPSSPQSDAVSKTDLAEERFKQGLSALQSGNRTLAITSLGEAARLVPTEPRYRAYYGRALTSEERMRRSAEAELKAAVDLDANNSSYRVMLAEFYAKIGLLRRAQGELERALSIDPKSEAARSFLDKLKGKG